MVCRLPLKLVLSPPEAKNSFREHHPARHQSTHKYIYLDRARRSPKRRVIQVWHTLNDHMDLKRVRYVLVGTPRLARQATVSYNGIMLKSEPLEMSHVT